MVVVQYMGNGKPRLNWQEGLCDICKRESELHKDWEGKYICEDCEADREEVE